MIEEKETIESEVDKEEVRSASHVMQSLVKAIKAFKIYLPNNPLHRKFFEQLKETLKAHLDEFGDMELEVDQFDIKLDGVPVYQNPETKESLAFKLNSDGIISLTFSEGIDESEISSFLEIVGKERPYETDDDIVTQLWTENLSHISYVVSEDTDEEFDGNSIGTGRESSQKQKEDIKSVYKGMPEAPPPPSPMTVPQHILSLSNDELGWLKRMKEFEQTRKPIDDVISIVTAILSSMQDIPMFRDFLEETITLVINLIKSGEVTCSLELIHFITSLEKNENMTAEHRKLLFEAKSKLFAEDMISALEKIVDHTDKIEPKQLKVIILMFGKEAVRPIINLLGVTSKKEMRKTIIEGLVEIAKDRPEEFIPCLKDDRWYLVRNAVLILRLIGKPVAAQEMRRLTSHKDPRVRKELLLYLHSISDETSMETTLRMLSDENGDLRKRALKVLTTFKYQPTLKKISAIVQSEEFEEKELVERQLFIEALGELGNEEALPILSDMLMTKYWLNKPREKEVVSLAIAGLRKIDPELAIKTLSDAKGSKRGEIAELLEWAIKGIAGKNK